jgi:hypothetical protein
MKTILPTSKTTLPWSPHARRPLPNPNPHATYLGDTKEGGPPSYRPSNPPPSLSLSAATGRPVRQRQAMKEAAGSSPHGGGGPFCWRRQRSFLTVLQGSMERAPRRRLRRTAAPVVVVPLLQRSGPPSLLSPSWLMLVYGSSASAAGKRGLACGTGCWAPWRFRRSARRWLAGSHHPVPSETSKKVMVLRFLSRQ